MAERFDVFISYSRRADEPLAEALQHDLQRFAKRAFQRRALQVFRDDANLSANPGLWSSIEQALDGSRFLLLLASPAAAASPWVAKEISHWRATQPAGHVLLAVTEGEVVWDEERSDFDLDRSSAIPPALAGAFDEEPRFVDLRAVDESQVSLSRDPLLAGAVADLAAPVHGRSKDELVGADLHEHRRLIRLTRAAVVVLSVLLVAALAAGLLAYLQRNRAQRSAADAEYRRLANAAATATTRPDALALALAALPPAARAGRPGDEALRPLMGALAREDLPVLRLAGQAPGQASTGERQGVDASLDGTTLAYITNAGDIDIWDLTRLERRTTIRAAELDGAADQVGLWPDGSRLVVVAFPASSAHIGDPVPATLITFDVAGLQPERRSSDAVLLRSASSVAFGPDPDTVAVMEEEGSMVVVQGHGPDLVQTALGDVVPTTNAEAMVTAFSTDGRRACSLGFEELQVYEIDPPAEVAALPAPPGAPDRLLQSHQDPAGAGYGCLPEPCGGSSDSFGAASAGGELHCYEADGTDVTTTDGPNLVSVAYSGLLSVPQVANVYGWRVAPSSAVPPPPLASVTPATSVERALIGATPNEGGLMNVRLVRAGPGVGLLVLDSDGLIQLWSASNGSLPTASWHETGDVETTLLAVSGPAGRAGALALDIDPAAPAAPARLVEVAGGEEVGRWDGSPAPRVPGAQGVPIALRERADGAILEVLDDGTVLARSASSGAATTIAQVAVTQPVAVDEVDLTDDRVALLDGATAVVADLSDGHEVARLAVPGPSCSTGPFLLEETTFVDLSEDGRTLAVVRCGADDRGTLSVVRDIDRNPTPMTAPLRYLFPTTVSVTDGGATAVVAFRTGQVAILRGDQSIEPDVLKAERAAHNSYQAGWAAIDPGGTLLVTRRDGTNVELWAITGTTVERVAQLADGDASEPPALAQFSPRARGITLAWSSAHHYDTGTRTAVTATWDLTRPFLLDAACAELAAGVPAGAAAQGVTSVAGCPSPGQ
jgi:TIR domain